MSRLFGLTLASIWLLVLTTFQTPKSNDLLFGALDLIGMLKLVVRVLVIGGLGGLLLLAMPQLDPRRGRALIWFGPLGLFVGWAGLSTLWSALPKITLGQTLSLLSLVIVALSLSVSCRSEADLSKVIKHLSWGLFACTILVLTAYFFVPGLAALRRGFGEGLFHPTNAAATSALGAILPLGAYLGWKWNWSRWALFPCLVLHSLVLVLAANRLAPPLVLLAMAALLACLGNRMLVLSGVVAICSCGAAYLTLDPGHAVASAVASSAGEAAQRGQSGREISSLSGRKEMWRMMWQSFLQSPVRGHGYFVTSKTGTMYVWYAWGNRTAHNFLLQVLTTTGIVGLLLLTTGVVVPAWFASIQLWQACFPMWLLMAVLGVWYLGWGALNESISGPLQPESVVFFSMLGSGVGLALGNRVGFHSQEPG